MLLIETIHGCQDAAEEEDDEEEEEEEEEEGGRAHRIRGEPSLDLLHPPTPINLPTCARTSPTSGSTRHQDDFSGTVARSSVPSGRVRVVKQY